MKLFQLDSPQPVDLPNLFKNLNWSVYQNETWTVFGPTGCGKTILKDIISKKIPLASGAKQQQFPSENITFSEISPQLEQALLDREIKEDDSEFTEGGLDKGRTAKTILQEKAPLRKIPPEWLRQLSLGTLLDTPYKNLSNGETRKILTLRALAQNSDILFLDSPFEGLDQNTYASINSILEHTYNFKTTKIFFLNNWTQVPKYSTGIIWLERNETPRILNYEQANLLFQNKKNKTHLSLPTELQNNSAKPKPNPFISLKDISIRYGQRYIFKNFSWTMRPNEAWLFNGPNGAGKTSLLQIIHADHPQSYGQNIRLFGIQRGQGESIWDIKAHIGFVSVDFQRYFPTSMTGLAMVISGFHDSMGVYRKPSDLECHLSQLWLKTLNIDHLSDRYLSQMSWGEVRMLMIARALVKKPELLILDEPCQGLDETQKHQVLALIDLCARLFHFNLIYVTHHQEDALKCITHQLQWLPKKDGSYEHRETALN